MYDVHGVSTLTFASISLSVKTIKKNKTSLSVNIGTKYRVHELIYQLYSVI